MSATYRTDPALLPDPPRAAAVAAARGDRAAPARRRRRRRILRVPPRRDDPGRPRGRSRPQGPVVRALRRRDVDADRRLPGPRGEPLARCRARLRRGRRRRPRARRSWGTYATLDGAAATMDLDRRIAQVRGQGGDAVVSFGGASNTRAGRDMRQHRPARVGLPRGHRPLYGQHRRLRHRGRPRWTTPRRTCAARGRSRASRTTPRPRAQPRGVADAAGDARGA